MSSIELNQICVLGVDTLKRAHNIKQLLSRNGRLSQDIRIPVLENVTISIRDGERVGIIGGNGSGKSSLLKVITGIYPPHSGSVHVVGKVAPLIEMGIGFDLELTGRENIRVGLVYAGRSSEYSKELENQIIAFSGLEEQIDQPFKIYSSGMRARLSFAVSIFQKPDILLLDEVFATGDESFIDKAHTAMLAQFTSVPIAILVTHTPELIMQFCNRCIWMERGRIVADGAPEAIIDLYHKKVMAA